MTIEEKIDLFRSMVTLNKNEFIRIQIIKRRKDNPSLPYTEKTIDVQYFYSWDDVVKKIEYIKETCDIENARAYIRLNKQNSVDLTLRTINKMNENIINGCSHKNYRAWDSMASKGGSNEWWVLDIDSHHSSDPDLFSDMIRRNIVEHFNTVKKDAENSIVKIPTKSGIHLITKRFDRRILNNYNELFHRSKKEPIGLDKNGVTLLYWSEK